MGLSSSSQAGVKGSRSDMLSKDERERLVFKHFAESIGLLPGGTFESRPTPEPDILYTPVSGDPMAFELVEILDRDFSATIGRLLGTKDACHAYLDALPADEAGAFRAQYANADIFISFKDGMSIQRRRNALPRIFKALRTLPAGFEGDAFDDGSPLDALLDRITVHRGGFNGPLFDTPSVTWVGDPTVEALQGKMLRAYTPRGVLNLLAYIEANPMYPEEVWLADLEKYLATLDATCQFEHIYVYECRSASVRKCWQRQAQPPVR